MKTMMPVWAWAVKETVLQKERKTENEILNSIYFIKLNRF